MFLTGRKIKIKNYTIVQKFLKMTKIHNLKSLGCLKHTKNIKIIKELSLN
jgi:hypothetical protein